LRHHESAKTEDDNEREKRYDKNGSDAREVQKLKPSNERRKDKAQ
jgi:hypothetical protein